MFELDTCVTLQGVRTRRAVRRGTRVLPAVVLILAGVAAAAAQAEDTPPEQITYTITYTADYVSLLPGYAVPSKSYDTTGAGFTMSGIYGHQFATHWSIEGNIQGSVFETANNQYSNYYENGATADVVYLLRDRQNALFTPFALVGVGGVYDDFWPRNREGTAFIADAGIGLVTQPLLPMGLRLRFDARYVYDAHEGGHEGYRFLGGIDIPLGRVEHQVAYLPGKVEVHEVVKEVVKEVVRPWVDSDGDGVDDEHDLCPNTPRGLKVDAHGCVIENQTLDLQGVTFDFNKARLTQNAMTILDVMSGAFVGQPSMKVEIAGHTDSVGSATANLRLSQLRADAVRAYLISRGARPEQLTARGYGKSQLLVNPEAGDQDRERNRRVELRVLAR